MSSGPSGRKEGPSLLGLGQGAIGEASVKRKKKREIIGRIEGPLGPLVPNVSHGATPSVP